MEAIKQKILAKLRVGPLSWQALQRLFPGKHPEAVERAIYSLKRECKIFPIRPTVFRLVTADMSEQDYIDLTHQFADETDEELLEGGMRRCSKCHNVKPLEDYYIQKREHGGHRPDCKACVRERVIATRAARIAAGKVKERIELCEKRCNCCKVVKPIADFNLQRATPTRNAHRRAYCKGCERDKVNAYNAKVRARRLEARKLRAKS